MSRWPTGSGSTGPGACVEVAVRGIGRISGGVVALCLYKECG